MTDLHSHSVTAYPTVGGGTWSATLNLSTFTDGDPILYHASVTDENTNLTEIDRTGLKDTQAPTLNIPVTPQVLVNNASAVVVSGTSDQNTRTVTLTVTDLHSHSVTAYPTVGGGTWSATLNLSTFTDGDPILYHASVTDENTNLTQIDRTGLKDTQAPTLNLTAPTISIANASAVVVSGTSDQNGRTVDLTVTDLHGHSVTATPSPTIGAGTWTTTLNLSNFTDGDPIRYSALVRDEHSNEVEVHPDGIKDTVINIAVSSVPTIIVANVSAVPISGTADPDVLEVSVTLTDSGTGTVTRTGVAVVGGAWATTVNATDLANGSITVQANGLDDVSNPGASPTVLALKDTQAPTLAIPVVPVINGLNKSAVVVSGTSDQDGRTVTLTVTDQHFHTAPASPTVGGGTWSVTLDLSSFTDNDVITYNASVTDINTNLTEIDRTGIKDTVAPTVAFSSWTNPIDYDNAPSSSAGGTGENGDLIDLTVEDEHLNSVTYNDALVSGGIWSITGLNLTGLFDGDDITFSAVPTDPAGNTGAAVEVTATKYTGPVAPDAPTAVVATAGPARATISWTIPADDGRSPIIRYTVTAVGDATKTCTATGPTATSCVVTLLLPGTTYAFTVTATNDRGTSPPSGPSNSVLISLADPPGAPTGISGYGTNAAAYISWVAPAYNGGLPITSYIVTSSPGGLTCTTAALTCQVTGLANGSAYKFRVQAVNETGPSLSSDSTGWIVPREGNSYVPLVPSRVLNGASLSSLSWYTFPVTDRFPGDATRNVPSNATAVTGVLAVASPGSSALGFLALTPSQVPAAQLSTSTLNFPARDSRATGVTITLGPGGTLSLYFYAPYGGATAPVYFDVTGYFIERSSAATYVTLTPSRILDSRNGTGQPNHTPTKFAHRVPQSFSVVDQFPSDPSKNVPSWAIAVTANVTVTQQTSAGCVTVGPLAETDPTTGTVYSPAYTANNRDNRATAITVKLGAGGRLNAVWKGATGSTAQVLFDVNGYFVAGTEGAMYVPITPGRVLDTRKSLGSSTLVGMRGVSFLVANALWQEPAKNVPPSAIAVTGTLTVTRQKIAGFFALTPYATNSPSTSTLNFMMDNRASGVTVPLGGGRMGIIFAPYAGYRCDALFDTTGYFLPAP